MPINETILKNQLSTVKSKIQALHRQHAREQTMEQIFFLDTRL